MTAQTILGFALAYLGIGVVFTLAYVLAMKPERGEAMLGLIALFWPLVIFVDVALGAAAQIGGLVRVLSAKLRTQ